MCVGGGGCVGVCVWGGVCGGALWVCIFYGKCKLFYLVMNSTLYSLYQPLAGIEPVSDNLA